MAGLAFGAAGLALAAGAAAVLAGALAYGVLRAPAPSEIDRTPPADAAPAAPAELAPEIAAAPEAAAPSFDLVRIAPDGAAVIAGRAAPSAQVTIHGEEGPIAKAEADDAGDFVAIFRATPGTEPQALTLEGEDPAGARATSPDVVVLLPEAPGSEAAMPEAGEAAQDGAGAPSEETSAETAQAAAGDVAQAAPEAETAAVPAGAEATRETAAPGDEPAPRVAATVVLRGDAPVEATPAPSGQDLTLASISYAETGLVTLAGVGAAGARLRAYVDDRFAEDGAVGADGRWTLALGDVAAGVYRLRIDALRADGTVVSRIETPFQRDFPAVAAGGEPVDGRARPAAITVQPGNNLWTLARIHYGSGVLYTQIHTANRDLIRDPELIYPGQIFVLPKAAPAE